MKLCFVYVYFPRQKSKPLHHCFWYAFIKCLIIYIVWYNKLGTQEFSLLCSINTKFTSISMLLQLNQPSQVLYKTVFIKQFVLSYKCAEKFFKEILWATTIFPSKIWHFMEVWNSTSLFMQGRLTIFHISNLNSQN